VSFVEGFAESDFFDEVLFFPQVRVELWEDKEIGLINAGLEWILLCLFFEMLYL
jgi:hypothetical protein